MKIFLLSFFLLYSYISSSQKIIGAAMANEKGITENPKKAKYLFVLKNYGDTAFVKLDYNFAGPLKMLSTFKDSGLTILNGKYASYRPTGYLSADGQYDNNRKDGKWLVYDDTSHAIKEYKFHLDTLLSLINLDSLDKEKEKIKEDTTGQIEAFYEGGPQAIAKIISSNFQVPDRAATLTKGGTVRVRFVINTTGKPIDIDILKSVEFSFDEESMRVVSLLKDWVPASDKGKKVNAYRILPIVVQLE